MQNLSRPQSLSKEWVIGIYESFDGEKIRYGLYRKDPYTPITNYIVFFNGRSEYIEKYWFLPEDLNLPKSWAFLTFDHRGQGGSGGAPCHIDSFDTYMKDSIGLIEKIVADKPYYVFAHSQGALLSLYSNLKGKLRPEKLLLSSPFFEIYNPSLPIPYLYYTARFLSFLGFGEKPCRKAPEKSVLETSRLTTCSERFKEITNPCYTHPESSLSWFAACCEAQDFIFLEENIKKLNIPIHIFFAQIETVVSNKKIMDWVVKSFKLCGTQELHCSFFQAKHEIFNERSEIYQPAIKRVRQWLLG
ncbi:MAG: hypothetical protein CMP11_05025 [Zetaproteobacteria bacterium]|nr:hypothetical protein [Pseudobdellovibrionaceae bacterium]